MGVLLGEAPSSAWLVASSIFALSLSPLRRRLIEGDPAGEWAAVV